MFYAAPNFLKMGIKYINLSSFIQLSTIKDEKSAAKFHYIKTVSGKVDNVRKDFAVESFTFVASAA